jgi:hydroxymethylpyrimidine pyrophosphatase-like HAD family hydrolase
VIYSDLDGTMVGPRGCFFRREDDAISLEPARALTEVLATDVALVLVSGRTEAQLLEACGIFGADGFVAELGALVGWDRGRGRQPLRGAMPEQFDVIPSELIDALTSRYTRRLEPHDPWAAGHQFDVMLRGNVDAREADRWLAAQGAGWLRLHDNGRIAPRPTRLDVSDLHVYHLVPEGVDKGRAVAYDLERRGLRPEQAIAIGDSSSDLAMAPQVGRFHLVANGARVPHVRERALALDNVHLEEGAVGAGWASAVRSVLA